MAANKFATMLHRNTNKLTLILVYALLEWILIVLLLLNSLFSYLILKFADYFGLKRPCLWCSRLDHIFEPRTQKSYRDLVCDDHASEIGQLGYCSNHRKLAESQDMCEDCSSDCRSELPQIAFLPWTKQIGKVAENGEVGSALNCSCCGASVEKSRFYSPCVLIKPSWDGFDLVAEGGVDDQSDRSRSEFVADDQEQKIEKSREIEVGFVEDAEPEPEQRIEKSRDIQVGSVDEQKIEKNSEILVGSEENGEAEQRIEKSREIEVGSEDDEEPEQMIEKSREIADVDGGSDEGKDQELIKHEDGDLSFSIDDLSRAQVDSPMDASPEILPQHLEFFIGHNDYRLIPVELIDSTTEENQIRYSCEESNQDVVLNFDVDVKIDRVPEPNVEKICRPEEKEPLLPIHESEDEEETEFAESRELLQNARSMEVAEEEENDEIATAQEAETTKSIDGDGVHERDEEIATAQEPETTKSTDGDGVQETDEEIAIAQEPETTKSIDGEEQIATTQETETTKSTDGDDAQETAIEMDSHSNSESEEGEEIAADVSIGTEIPDHERVDEYQFQEDPSYETVQEHHEEDHGCKKDEEVEFKTISVETSSRQLLFRQVSQCNSELNDIDEDRVPDTPSSVDSLQQFSRKFMSLERRESGTESLDGSVISELEGGDLTVEKLSSALRAERKALNALYAELEEERSASAVAANQTMAMINRLHEEKAAMQMEALQYQRMMEEQSEYDQEALQLLNELMVKREREKQELEKELEAYRKKVMEYEAREKMLMLRRKEAGMRSRSSIGSSSVSCSNAEEDSDVGSVDLNQESKEDHLEDHNHNTPADAVLYLEESLASFEEERMSILKELKVLEEKLFTMSNDDEPYENGHAHENGEQENGFASNGHSEESMNGKHNQAGRRMVSKAKRLLPLFDAIELEGEGENGFDSASLDHHDCSESRYDDHQDENKRPGIEEEVDHVYERLQALEADREFLKHCMSSLRKGDKGVYLLQEILQHLRDLRNVDLRARNIEDGVLQ